MTDDVRRDLVRLLPRLRRFAYSLVGDASKADDLVQESCARACANLDAYQPGTRLDSWMYRIVRNVWLNQKRAQGVRGPVIEIDAVPDAVGEDGRDVAESRIMLKRVMSALKKLPQEQQELIALICIEGVSYQEAADILNLPLGTVTSRLARGRRALHAMAIEGAESLEG